MKRGPELELSARSTTEAAQWAGAVKALMVSTTDDTIKSELVRSLLADGSARQNLRRRFDRKTRKLRESAVASFRNTMRPPMTELRAAVMLQKVFRGHQERRLVSNWKRVVDEDDGDIYYFNIKTGTSSWHPPTHPETIALMAASAAK